MPESANTRASHPDTASQEAVYDGWYRHADRAHWEDAPGKCVLLAAMSRCCDPEAQLRLLDIGCGTGSFLDRIRCEVSRRWQLHGIDLSGKAIARGRARFGDLQLDHGDGANPDYSPARFDVITCYGSWEHFPEPAAAIAGAARVLAPGGRVFAMIPALGVHRTDRDDEGWYEDTEVDGAEARQLQWNLRRGTWARMFEDAGIHLFEAPLAKSCGAHKPGVFFFGLKVRTAASAESTDSANKTAATSASASAFRELARLAARMATDLAPQVEAAGKMIAASLKRGGTVLVCGNGGSAADAQHFAAELVGRLRRERPSLPAISLCTDPSVVTALANDYGYEKVFARQIEGLGRTGDVLLVISTSGLSSNVVEAVRAGERKKLVTIALLGNTCPPELAGCDLSIHVPHDDGQRIQEAHAAVLHAMCSELEGQLHGED